MKLDRLYIDDDGKLRNTKEAKRPLSAAAKTGIARAVEVHANLIHKPPTAMRVNPVRDIKIPNI